MKAERRQELRTNELAQQLDQASEYIKQNAAMLTAVVVVAAVIVGGFFWYWKRQQNELMAGWAALSQRNPPADAAPPVETYRSVADENIDPALTVQAWLKIGEAAMSEMIKPKKADSSLQPGKNWAQIAEDAYTQALDRAQKDLNARGQAMISLGLLAENKGDMEKARQWYQKVADDKVYAESPLNLQASYRLNNMKYWSAPVVFPPPPAPPIPTTAPAVSLIPTSQPVGAASIPTLEVPDAVKRAAMESNRTATTQPAGN